MKYTLILLTLVMSETVYAYTDEQVAQAIVEAQQQTPGATMEQIKERAESTYGISADQFNRASESATMGILTDTTAPASNYSDEQVAAAITEGMKQNPSASVSEIQEKAKKTYGISAQQFYKAGLTSFTPSKEADNLEANKMAKDASVALLKAVEEKYNKGQVDKETYLKVAKQTEKALNYYSEVAKLGNDSPEYISLKTDMAKVKAMITDSDKPKTVDTTKNLVTIKKSEPIKDNYDARMASIVEIYKNYGVTLSDRDAEDIANSPKSLSEINKELGIELHSTKDTRGAYTYEEIGEAWQRLKNSGYPDAEIGKVLIRSGLTLDAVQVAELQADRPEYRLGEGFNKWSDIERLGYFNWEREVASDPGFQKRVELSVKLKNVFEQGQLLVDEEDKKSQQARDAKKAKLNEGNETVVAESKVPLAHSVSSQASTKQAPIETLKPVAKTKLTKRPKIKVSLSPIDRSIRRAVGVKARELLSIKDEKVLPKKVSTSSINFAIKTVVPKSKKDRETIVKNAKLDLSLK